MDPEGGTTWQCETITGRPAARCPLPPARSASTEVRVPGGRCRRRDVPAHRQAELGHHGRVGCVRGAVHRRRGPLDPGGPRRSAPRLAAAAQGGPPPPGGSAAPPPSEPPVPGPALRRRHCRVTEAEPRDESTESRCKHVAPWSGSPPRQQILVRPHQLYRRTALDPPVQLCRPLILARGRMSALTLVKAAQSTDDWMLCHSGGRCTWSGWCQR